MLDGDVGSSTRADIFEKAPPGPLPPDGDRRAEHAGRRRRAWPRWGSSRSSAPSCRSRSSGRWTRSACSSPRPGANVKITPGLRRAVHRPDRDEPHHRGRPRDHAGDAGHGRRVAPCRRHRGRRGRCAGPRRTRARATCASSATRRRGSSATTTRFAFGKAEVIRDGADVTLIDHRDPDAPDAARRRSCWRPTASMRTCSTWRRSSRSTWRPIVAAAERTGRVITVEEHTVLGGLGGAVAETLAEHRPTRCNGSGSRTRASSRVPTMPCSTSTGCRRSAWRSRCGRSCAAPERPPRIGSADGHAVGSPPAARQDAPTPLRSGGAGRAST